MVSVRRRRCRSVAARGRPPGERRHRGLRGGLEPPDPSGTGSAPTAAALKQLRGFVDEVATRLSVAQLVGVGLDLPLRPANSWSKRSTGEVSPGLRGATRPSASGRRSTSRPGATRRRWPGPPKASARASARSGEGTPRLRISSLDSIWICPVAVSFPLIDPSRAPDHRHRGRGRSRRSRSARAVFRTKKARLSTFR